MPEIEPVKTVYPDIEYSEKKSHEIEHFESASKTEQVEVGVADRNRNVSAKYVISSLPLLHVNLHAGSKIPSLVYRGSHYTTSLIYSARNMASTIRSTSFVELRY